MVESIVKLIDHAVLQPTQTDEDVRAACSLGAEIGVASVCVKPSHVTLAVDCLRGSRTFVSTVIGFPHGGTTTEAKAAETVLVCRQGAQEVDMVVNIGKVLSGDWAFVEQDIRAVVEAARTAGRITKVIFETGLLPDDKFKIRLCEISEAAGAAFVKTSTGFGYAKRPDGTLAATGATEHDVRLMREHCSAAVQVKASGGIRNYEDARRFVDLGATRLGTSGTKEIAAGERGTAAKSMSDY
ncbi:MAG: deoxyribose-phosphate aldolase [Planctomycetes bacterium]|nr:deoxyribose-phosphate aldolase [Planctomycetota bacterium]